MTVPRRSASAWSEAASVPFPASEIRTRAARCEALTSTVVGSLIAPVARAARWSAAIPAVTRRRRDVGRADDDDRGKRLAGERLHRALVDLHHGQVAGKPLDARVHGVQAERRDRERDQEPAARPPHSSGRRNTSPTIAGHNLDSPSRPAGRWTNGRRPRSTRSPNFESTAGSTVSEPTIAIATTSTVPTPKDWNDARAHQEHAGHRRHDGQPGDEHRAARGRRRDLQRVLGQCGPARAPRARGAGRRASSRRPTARPISRITELIDSSTCNRWLSSAVSPSAAATAVMPSRSGIPAATSAPKASTRIRSVTGSEVNSARWKSSAMRCSPPGGARRPRPRRSATRDAPAAPRRSPRAPGRPVPCAVSGSPVIWNGRAPRPVLRDLVAVVCGERRPERRHCRHMEQPSDEIVHARRGSSASSQRDRRRGSG